MTAAMILIGVVSKPLNLDGSYEPPWDTFALLALWLWCFIVWMRSPPDAAPDATRPRAADRISPSPGAPPTNESSAAMP